MLKSNHANKYPPLAQIALESRIVPEKHLIKALQIQEKYKFTGNNIPLEDVLYAEGMISLDMLHKLFVATVRFLDRNFGEIAIQKGFTSQKDIETALEKQAEEFKKARLLLVGDILLEKGLIQKKQYDHIMFDCQQREEFQATHKNKFFSPQSSPTFGVHLEKLYEDHTKEKNKECEIKEKGTKEPNIPSVTLQEIPTDLKIKAIPTQPSPKFNLESLANSIEPISNEKIQTSLDRINEKLDKQFCLLALKLNIVTKNQIEQAVAIQKKAAKEKTTLRLLNEILVDEGIITISQCNAILKVQGRKELQPPTKTLASQNDATHSVFPKDISSKEKTLKHVAEKSSSEENNDEEKKNEKSEKPKSLVHYIEISQDALLADLIIPKGAAMLTTIDIVNTLIDEKNIVFGREDEEKLVETIANLRNEDEEQRIIIAKGIKPKIGIDGYITYHFTTDFLKPGTVDIHGVMDYKDRGDIPYVKQGDLLAEKTEAIQGEPGMDIFGNQITVPEVKNPSLTAGKGTLLSEDKSKLFATIDGTPNTSLGEKISVFKEFTIKGDVGLHTGHINFDGNIIINGSIHPGFKVTGVDITAYEINEGEIIADGHVTISSGIIDSKVIAKGNVQAKFVSNSYIETYGDLIVQKEILDSKAIISGTCINTNGEVISSELVARKGMALCHAGTNTSKPCFFKVGTDDHIKIAFEKVDNEIKIIFSTLETHALTLGGLEQKQMNIHSKISILAQVQDKMQNKERILQQKIENLKEAEIEDKQSIIIERDTLKQNYQKSKKIIDDYFVRQEQLEDKINETGILLQETNESLEEKISFRKAIKKWHKTHPYITQIKISGIILEKTIVKGQRAGIKLSENYRNVIIKEMKKENNIWVMEIRKG